MKHPISSCLKTILRPISLVSLCTLASFPLCAMDLREAYSAALLQDAQLKASQASRDAANERVIQARAQLLPSISASASVNRNSLDTTSPNFLGVQTTNHDIYQSSNRAINLRQPLLRIGSVRALDQTRTQAQEAAANLATETQNLAVRVSGAYFECLYANDQLRLTQAQLANTRTQLDAAHKALKAGSGTRTDVDLAQAKLDLNTAQELEARQNLAFTARQLQVLTNTDADQFNALDPQQFSAALAFTDSLDTWLSRAENQNQEIQALKARVASAEYEVSKAVSGHAPTLDLVAQVSVSKSENLINIRSTYDSKSVGLQFNLPLYSGGGQNAMVRQAMAILTATEQQLEATRRDVMLRVHREHRSLSEGLLKVRALEQAQRSATVALDSTQKSFKAGARTLLDVLTADQSLVQTQRDLAQARYLWLTAKVRLLALGNQADESSIESINRLLQGTQPSAPPGADSASVSATDSPVFTPNSAVSESAPMF